MPILLLQWWEKDGRALLAKYDGFFSQILYATFLEMPISICQSNDPFWFFISNFLKCKNQSALKNWTFYWLSQLCKRRELYLNKHVRLFFNGIFVKTIKTNKTKNREVTFNYCILEYDKQSISSKRLLDYNRRRARKKSDTKPVLFFFYLYFRKIKLNRKKYIIKTIRSIIL